MTLQDRWREAITRIALQNGPDVSAMVFAERQHIRPDPPAFPESDEPQPTFSPELARQIYARHDPDDLHSLHDYVVYLVWRKLRQGWPGQPEADRFLGITDLIDHLSARVPLYIPAELGQFRTDAGDGYGMGDLRWWLCARGKPALYTNKQLDLHLRELDIEERRRTAGGGADEQPDYELAEDLPRSIPWRIHAYAHLLTFQLVTGCCDCPEAFATPQTQFRGYRAAERRCKETHFLSEENLDALRQKNDLGTLQDAALEFIERAATGACTVDKARGTAQSMFCNVYVTPGERKIRLAEYGLTETDRFWHLLDDDGINQIQAPGDCEYPCIWCPKCLCFIGSQRQQKKCRAKHHAWQYGMVEAVEDLEGDWCDVTISVCPAHHFWPHDDAQLHCPVCGLTAVRIKKRVKVFKPTNRNFGDGEWPWELPRPPGDLPD